MIEGMAEDFVSVFWTQSWVEGEIAKGRLEAEGIPVDFKGEDQGPYPTGPAELLVPSSFEAQARRILEEVQGGSDEVQHGREDDVRREQTREQPE
jgi:Putative prokaryotic signal transducing protein